MEQPLTPNPNEKRKKRKERKKRKGKKKERKREKEREGGEEKGHERKERGTTEVVRKWCLRGGRKITLSLVDVKMIF